LVFSLEVNVVGFPFGSRREDGFVSSDLELLLALLYFLIALQLNQTFPNKNDDIGRGFLCYFIWHI
jgi:hypothetical protein